MFRREFRIPHDSSELKKSGLPIHVSADSRYLLYCNGSLVGRGPARGDVTHHFYDTHELLPYLKDGDNVLAALVLDMSKVAHRPSELGAPCAIMTYAGGFLVEGEFVGANADVTRLDTGEPGWRVAVDTAHRFQNVGTRFEGYHGYFEHRVGRDQPAGWTSLGFDASSWPEATTLYLAELRENRRDPTSPYGLMPRMIPMLEEGAPEPFPDAYVAGGGEVPEAWRRLLAGDAPLTLRPGEKVDLVLDMGRLTTAFPHLDANGGSGSVVRLTYAEALRLSWDSPGAILLGKKQSLANLASHFADESTGWTFDRRGKVTGWCDIWEPSGRNETFEPLHWRAFRYVGLQITVGAEPLTLCAVRQRFTAYPYRVTASFESSDPALDKIWTVGLHTMRMCSHETFEDCPHYEQMQYAGDTMVTSQIGMLTTGDSRLSRQALFHFDWSRLTDGLTQSRYPSRLVQVIPAWSIHWITNIRDYFLCTGDRDTVSDLLPGVRAVLDWYRRHAGADGLPAKLPFWNITDWCPWWPRGVVPGADAGATCIHSSQYINGLNEAAWILRHFDRTTEADGLAAEAAALRRTAHALFWSEEEGLYFDRPGGPEVSQYGNAWAVVAGLAGERERAIIVRRFPGDPKLAPGSFFWWHTGFNALARCGRSDEFTRHLGPWHESIGYGLSTFVEENSYWRSLCHAWSAHPVLEFQKRILGVVPVEPGFARISLRPHRCGLTHAKGSVCTPRGLIEVAWRVEHARFFLNATIPPATKAQVTLPDGATRECSSGQNAFNCLIE